MVEDTHDGEFFAVPPPGGNGHVQPNGGPGRDRAVQLRALASSRRGSARRPTRRSSGSSSARGLGKFLKLTETPGAYASHPLGGCRMADEVGLGVIDHGCEVFGNEGLFCMDSSAIPTQPRRQPVADDLRGLRARRRRPRRAAPPTSASRRRPQGFQHRRPRASTSATASSEPAVVALEARAAASLAASPMTDDDDPRSTGATGRSDLTAGEPRMTALLLVLLLLLLIAQRRSSSPPSSRSCARGAAGSSRSRRRASAAPPGSLEQLDHIDEYLVRLPGRDHDGLDRDRLPRRAGDRRPDRADLRRPLARRRRSAISFAIAFTLATSLHITIGEQVPKMLAISRAESDRAGARAAAELVPRRSRARSPPG